MEILLTGRLACVTPDLSRQMLHSHKVVLAAGDLEAGRLGKGITPFQISPREEGFEKIFHAYHFDVAVFFSQQIGAGGESFGEYEELERFLKLCAAHDVNRVLYIQSCLYGQGSARGALPGRDIHMLFSACEQLCAHYRRHRAMSVVVCRVPSLYGRGESASLAGRAISQARGGGTVRFHGAADQRVGFLSQQDLGELLLRIVESWMTEYETIDVAPGNTMTLGELGRALKSQISGLQLSYQGKTLEEEPDPDYSIPKKEYDWIPVGDLEEELPGLIRAQEAAPEEDKLPVIARLGRFLKKHPVIIKLAELAIGFVLMELLNRVTSTTIQFQYIDFRLLYIVLMGTLHGMRTGLAAAGLSSVSLFISLVQGHSNWGAIAYNIDTWLPFIFFFLIGAVTGYIKDRMRNDNRFLSEEKALLEEKYVLLNEFYASALQNKDQYKTQIMSYRDSFGRLFDITKSLDSTLVDEVFREALSALEGVLDNQSVCIYSCDEKMLFGRLIVCSKEIRDITGKSLNLSKLGRMTGEFQDGEVWVNRERLENYPEYAVALYHEDKPIALIILQKVSYEQLAVYYENLVKIICGLIKISLVRAMEYTQKTEDEIYLPGSRIILNSYFSQIVQVKEEMAKNGIAEYVLIHFSTTPQNLLHVGAELSRLIRQTDILGLGRDDELYLCLAQTNQSNIQVVLERIRKSGLVFRETTVGEGV